MIKENYRYLSKYELNIFKMTTSTFKTKQFLLLLFLLLTTTAASGALGQIATAKNINNLENVEVTHPPLPASIKTNSHLELNQAWGHNTKYSTIIFDENILVKGRTLVDIKYPTNDDLYNDYTIIGIYTFAFDKLSNDISVYIWEGGVGSNFTKIRFVSKATDDVEFNLKMFGINV